MIKYFNNLIKWFEKHNKLSWIITILIAVFIFYFSSLSFEGVSSAGIKSNVSVIYHIGIFFFLSLFLFISLIKGKKNSKLFLFSFFVVLAYGIIDEIHQFFIPGRLCTGVDVFFDLIGILLALMVYLISLKLR
ncbi:VanZ family protein [Candidatus Pacearchaeota archaeon]|nr:VanZ family protein [Candidatus Pacearchaeota archaeon]